MATQTEQLIDRVVKAPMGVKIGAVFGVVAVLTAVNWQVLVTPVDDKLSSRIRYLQQRESEYIKNQAIANNLNQFKREKEILERRLAQALTELPNESNIDELIRSLYEVGTKSGLTIGEITPGVETREGFYAKIPLAMTVAGNYHEIAVFFDSISKLPRIVNISNIKLRNPVVKNEKIVVASSYVATTFRFIPQEQPKAAPGAPQ
jgi:type IV pilus assembly protein PilO